MSILEDDNIATRIVALSKYGKVLIYEPKEDSIKEDSDDKYWKVFLSSLEAGEESIVIAEGQGEKLSSALTSCIIEFNSYIISKNCIELPEIE